MSRADSDVGIRQALITKLATDPGIQMIKALVELQADEETDANTMFTEITIPFLRTISHPDVSSSLILEAPITTICNFLFGPNGARLITLFSFTSSALNGLLNDDTTQAKEQLRIGLTASLAVLLRIVELCQTAQILEELEPILDTLSECFPDGCVFQAARQSLNKIQRRYNIGKSMPQASLQIINQQSEQPRFPLELDLPGHLSAQGPRHDNDHVEIQNIQILPTSEEIQSQRQEYLPPADVSISRLPGLRGLLDRQFRLLREDSVGGLRDAVQFEIEGIHNKTSGNNKDAGARNIVHQGANIMRLEIDKRKGLQIVVGFAQPSAVRNKNEKQREEWWAESKQMQFDALVCLISSSGRTIFFSVCDPNPTPPKANTRLEDGNGNAGATLADLAYMRRRAEMPSLHKDPERAALVLNMVDFKDEDVRWLTSEVGKSSRSENTLVEFPGILLPSFKPTLEALQAMSQSLDLPFQELIAPDEGNIEAITLEPPAYSRRLGFAYDLSPLTGNESLTFVPGQSLDHEKLERTTVLDRAQQASALHALSSSLALIQGPPGTGKSYTGVAIIKTLLKNRDAADLGPIICVCYTNHALDQLLESLVQDHVEKVIRIGSRSKSDMLQKLNLQHVAQEIETTKTERRQKWENHRALDAHLIEIDKLLNLLNDSNSQKNIRDHLEIHHPKHFNELFSTGADADGFEMVVGRRTNLLHRWLNGFHQHEATSSRERDPVEGGIHDREHIVDVRNTRSIRQLSRSPLDSMSSPERRILYNHWVRERTSDINDQLLNALDSYSEAKESLETCKQEVNLRCLLQAHVIGVTTSGLARNLEVLRKVRAKVVICEEAGEVLEAHILTALLPSVEHAILIGDHEQLRPQINNYELQHDHPRGERFALDVSLFERFIRPRSGEMRLPFTTLRTQRRMHPSISELIRKTLYPALEDHPSVCKYPEVDGMRKRLFWLDHEEKEDRSTNHELIRSFSKSNSFEVEMVAAIVSHLVRQGTHSIADIVVLTPYLGQLKKIKQRLRSSFEIVVGERDLADLDAQGIRDDEGTAHHPSFGPRKATLSKTLRVATVDNFQGEEAKVVVISLVRSNEEGRCGFLKTSNRINVLLSRARHGMYIVGNSQTASSVQMWANVVDMLKENGNLGRKLALCCPRHTETPIEVQTPDDFAMFSPEGGCHLKCISRLPCGHACINQCHSEVLHNAVRCLERCQRLKSSCTHPCPRPCGDPCDPKCLHPIANVQLPCGHTYDTLECYKAQAPEMVTCRMKVGTVITHCNHTVMIPCCDLPLKDDFECPAVCNAKLGCGHACTRKCKECRIKHDGEIIESHGVCKKVCERPFTTCNHNCRNVCHGNTPCLLCEALCDVRCTHSICSKKCHEPCVPCVEDCAWSCPHRGRCQMPCAVPCDLQPCSRRCEKRLLCSHQCPSLCGEVCPNSRYCQLCADESVKGQMVDYILGSTYSEINLDESPVIVPACGHILTVESMDGHMDLSRFFEISDQEKGGERVLGLKPNASPFSTEDLKNCPICRSPLRDIHRYGRIVRRAWIDEATKKFIVWANARFVPLTVALDEIEDHLREVKATSEINFGVSAAAQPQILTAMSKGSLMLKGGRDAQFNTFSKLLGKQLRYKAIVQLRYNIAAFLQKVAEAEQPFSRIYDLVQDARLHRGLDIAFEYMPEILQTRNRMLATVLLLRCDYTILLELLALYKEKPANAPPWMTRKLDVDFTINRQDCEKLMRESQEKKQPTNEVEGLLFWARFVALERGVTENQEKASELVVQARQYLHTARDICKLYPGQTKGMLAEVDDVLRMLRESTFYVTVTNDEKAAVYAAMANELRGTGHWYYCVYGHPFTVGECGMPMQTSVCPQCGSPVGGQSHQSVEGVTRAADMDAQFAEMRIG